MIIFLNVLQDIILILFFISVAYVLIQDKHNVYGVRAKNKNKDIILNGTQGVDVSLGKQNNCDIVVRSEKTPENITYLTYDGKTVSGANKQSKSFAIGDEDISFIKSAVYLIRFKYLPMILTIIFLVLRYFSLCQDFKDASKILLIPFALLLVYLVINALMDVNTSPVIESSFVILLSYHIYACLFSSYGADADAIKGEAKKCIIGIALYILVAIFARLFISYFRYTKEYDIKGLQRLNKNEKFKKLIGDTVTPLDLLRFACAAAILALALLNLFFAVVLDNDINGAYNWIVVGGKPLFQPSEFIKPLFLMMLLVPINKQFKDRLNLIFMFLVSLGIFLYAIEIKDIGFLLEMAAVWFLQIVIFSNNLRLAMVMSSGAILGSKLILLVSVTARKRFFSWKNDEKFFVSFFGSIIENDSEHKGFQPLKAVTGAIMNGHAFGRKYIDIDVFRYPNGKMVPASDSDIVTGILSQRYGFIALFLLFGIILTILLGAIRNISKQNKNQQALTMMTCVLMSVAFILNIGGTYGVLPLTGVVAPALSKGNSAAISYGACFGFLTCISPYIRDIFRNSRHEEFKKGKLLTAACTVPAINKALDSFEIIDLFIDEKTNAASDKIREKFNKKETEKSEITIKRIGLGNGKPKKSRVKGDSSEQKKKVGKWIGFTALLLVAVLLISVFGSIGKALSNINQREKAAHITAAEDLVRDKNVYNVLLLGVDARSEDDDESSRADTMLMVSIDKNNKSVKMTSFLRDSWVYIPARESKGRLNSASSYGGYSGVVDAIEHNFRVGIDGFAVVDFEMFKVLVDAIGGVTINVTEKEANEINGHPKRYGNVKVDSGENVLNGDQALAYARIRKIDTDFVRTKRQRTVMNAIIQKAKSKPFKFLKAMKKASAFIETDLTKGEIVKCGLGSVKCSKHIYQNRVPFEKTWEYATVNGASVIKMNIKKNKEQLINYIYDATPEELDKENDKE